MRKRIIGIAISLLIMIPATLSYAGSELLSGFPSSATVGDSITYTISPSDEAVSDAEITVSPSSGAELSASGLSFTITFSAAGTYTLSACAGDESDSCTITVSETEESSEDAEDENDSSDTPSENETGDEETMTGDQDKQSPSKGKGVASGMKGASSGAQTGASGTASDSSTTYPGSADNYLESLDVEGFDFSQPFHKTRNTYFITAGSEVSSLEITAEPSDDSATVVVTGADNLSEGRNKVMVNVTADNGDVRVYRIYVDIT